MYLKVLMIFFRKIDNKFGLNAYEFARALYLKLVDIANIIFRVIDKYRLFAFRNNKKNKPIKLHLGCGERHKDGYLNIDWRKTQATDFVCDITAIPFKNNSISVIESYHVIEHLSKDDAIKTLENWYKMLEVGGKLVIECPNFDEAVKEYLDGNQDRIYNIFGYRRFPGDGHLFGYNYERLAMVLTSIGFSNICNVEPQDYHIAEEPCLRVEGVKGN